MHETKEPDRKECAQHKCTQPLWRWLYPWRWTTSGKAAEIPDCCKLVRIYAVSQKHGKRACMAETRNIKINPHRKISGAGGGGKWAIPCTTSVPQLYHRLWKRYKTPKYDNNFSAWFLTVFPVKQSRYRNNCQRNQTMKNSNFNIGKDEVASSNLASSSNSSPLKSIDLGGFLLFSKHFWNICGRRRVISTLNSHRINQCQHNSVETSTFLPKKAKKCLIF